MSKANIPKSHLATEEDLPLLQLTHTFAQASVWLAKGMDKAIATYDCYVRDMPPHRNFLVAGGLEEILLWLPKLRFSAHDVAYLVHHGLITKACASYLRRFRFTGDIAAMKEGTIFFPGEPIIRVTAPLIEASLIETYLMSAVTSHTIFLSKAVRFKIASQDRFELRTGPFRAHSFESAFKAARAAEICGMPGGRANLCISKKYHIATARPIINGQHLFVSSFPREIDAFRALAETFPDNCSFMIDTYNVQQGIKNAIIVADELKQRGKRLRYVCIDSGDVIRLTKETRQALDSAGHTDVSILLAGNFDEQRIRKLTDTKTPCTTVVAVTEYMTVSDAPKLEVVYKLSELRYKGRVHYSIKLAHGKRHDPGSKQVFRILRRGKIMRDVIGLVRERLGKPILKPVMRKGRVRYTFPSLKTIRFHLERQVKQLLPRFLSLTQVRTYPVARSKKLEQLFHTVKRERMRTKAP